jgi:hypothetical protein
MPVQCVCEICGKTFTTVPSRILSGRDKCCSKACADVSRRHRQVELVCENPACGKIFIASQSMMARGTRFCSNTCYRPPVMRLCQNPTCGKTFNISPAEIRKGGGKYCCWQCRPKAQPCICQNPICQKTFWEIPSNITQGRGKYCSPKCHQVHRKCSWEERFWSHVARCDHELWCLYCCWEWQAGTSLWGYGLFQMTTEGKTRGQRAHRIAWSLLNAQPIPPGLLGLHHCDNPPCCNPMHIHIGTHLDNSHDAVMRGRLKVPRYGQIVRGEKHWNSKLTENQVREIVQRHRRGELQSTIARDLGVSRPTINMVLQRKVWRHITDTLSI